MERLKNEYEKISEKIRIEKEKESERLFTSLVDLFYEESKNKENDDQENDDVYENKKTMFSLYCARASVNYHMIRNGNDQYEMQMAEDIQNMAEQIQWLEGRFSIKGQVLADIVDILEIVGEIPEEMVLKCLKCEPPETEQKVTADLFHLVMEICQYFFQEEQSENIGDLLKRLIQKSRERNFLTHHRELVIEVLARWGEMFPETGLEICRSESVNFFPENDDYGADFLWFYGCILESLQDMKKAITIFHRCYILREKLYGALNWFTVISKREYNFCLWIVKKDKNAFQNLKAFIKDTKKENYSSISEEVIDEIKGKTLYVLLYEMVNAQDLEDFEYYLNLYELICDKYEGCSERYLQKKIAYNFRGNYEISRENYMLAEKAFLQALSADWPEESELLLTQAQIKSNLLCIYSLQNDIKKMIPLLQELLEILEEDAEYKQLEKRDEYRIYSLMVSLEMQGLWEISEEEINDLRELAYDTCSRIIECSEEIVPYAKEMAAFLISAVAFLIGDDHTTIEEKELCRKALRVVEANQEFYELSKSQQSLLFYISAVVSWDLKLEDVESYIQKSLEMQEDSRIVSSIQLVVLQFTGLYYAQNHNVAIGKEYIEKTLKKVDSLWRSYVRYLNENRLLQILSPVQEIFTGCYTFIREYETLEYAYEKILQYKALASLAGKERNRILHKHYENTKLLTQIQELQNKIASWETENIFRDASNEYENAENMLRELEAEFSLYFPMDNDFVSITLENVYKNLPEDAVVIEYFTCWQISETENDQEPKNVSGIDVYIIYKKNGQCKLERVTVPDAIRVQSAAAEFLNILQAKANGFANISQMERLEILRSMLYKDLIQPVEGYIQNVQVLYIAPDYDLLNLPFGILCDEDENLLDEKYTIIEIECARDFLYGYTDCPAPKDMLILGNPEYRIRENKWILRTDAEDSQLERWVNTEIMSLPFSEAEIRQISKRTGNPYYSGKDASKKRFLSAGEYRNIHVATHGYFDLDMETESIYSSGLLFTGVDNWRKNGKLSKEYGNGVVTADEVSRMNLHGTELMVLSSCLSGMNEIFDDKGFHGMIGALSAAGVRYVVSTFWAANDFSTAIFMDVFYYEYIENRQSPPNALKRAKQYLKHITIGQLRKEGWFDYLKTIIWDLNGRKVIETYEKCNDRVRPFKNEEYWGGFVCYRCN